MKRIPISNNARILHLIYERQTASNKDIARELDLSLPTVLQHVKELRAMGLVMAAGKRASTGGRRANELMGVPLSRLFGGIEISRHHFTMVIVDMFATVVAIHRCDIAFSVDEEYLLTLRTKFESFVKDAGYSMSDIRSIGLAMSGILNFEQRGAHSSRMYNLHKTLIETIQSMFDLPSRFYRGAYAGGYAELRNAGKDKAIAYLSLSSSVNLAFFNNGQFYAGNNDRAGMIAHSALHPNGRKCYCGREGCVAAYLSSDILCEFGSIDEFFEHLGNEEQKYVKLWDEYINNLALLIDRILNAYDCDVIIGGYVGFRMSKYMERLRGIIRDIGIFKDSDAPIRVGSYKHGVAAIGAAVLQLDQYIDDIDKRLENS